MSEFYQSMNDVRYTAAIGHVVTVAGTLKDTGVAANADGRKIVPAGYPIKPASSTIVGAMKDGVACGAGEGPLAEVILVNDVDVTDGDAAATFMVEGILAGSKLIGWPSGAQTALASKGFRFVGAVNQNDPPALAFEVVDHTSEADQYMISTVDPAAGANNSYIAEISETDEYVFHEVGTDMSGGTAYVLGSAIVASEGEYVALYEVDATGKVIKAGIAQIEVEEVEAPAG